MSFGVVQSAISVINNNRKLISKRNKFKSTLSGLSENKVEFKARKATLSELRFLRERIRRENQLIMRRRIIVAIEVMIILLLVFYYYF
ncbi:hypothetical protein [Confluentibacter flavum]|uniref:Uncharacterized protein n=1 Tax=Confluentibacter flavum TaxID=1909700 RepID=A0A2N3HFL5_9FLAO|nr:hypothetical protein [Confluentibacter flavum]PKQ43769.1 hypothetical protein CSW08_17410 [Confluentibacter flavum]